MVLNRLQKEAIGKVAAALFLLDEGVLIDGGSTTLQMCPHLAGLNLLLLTNALHIVTALINQSGIRVLDPSGALLPEQSILLAVFGKDGLARFHAPKPFMRAAAIGPQGLAQDDILPLAAERRLTDRAEEIIVRADARKFEFAFGNLVFGLDEIDTIIADARMNDAVRTMLEAAKFT